ncbi:MAG: site-specific DNA-methyltransferase [Candidatus Hydrogenedentes bacterium]|nr:site-specific DNA-methyltransferase [Candidatus Hydrogenedentota bacterium]
MARLTEQEQQEIIRYIEADKPLPEKYRFLLFEDKREVELVWNGKTSEVCSVVLPFQVIEQVDEPRAEKPSDTAAQMEMFSTDERGRQLKGWTNKLIWGDNKLVLSSLKNGPMREDIEAQGGLKLIYIDPPFDVGADFSMDIEIGGDTFTKKPNILEEIAYRDTWGKGADSFLAMIYERLVLMRDLLAEDGLLFLHIGWNVSHHVRLVLDEVFGPSNFINQIIWRRQTAHSDIGQGSRHLGRIHDVVLLYSKADRFAWNMQYQPYSEEYASGFYKEIEPETGRRYQLGDITAPGGASKGNPYYEFLGVTRFWRFSEPRMRELYDKGIIVQKKPGTVPRQKRYLDEMPGVPLQDLWLDINTVQPQARERTGYSTQKPELILERIISLASNEGDLVADFFCGSGTLAAVAEKLGRKWIVSDLGKFAVHTTRKRMIGVQRALKAEGKDYRAFEILNLGKYERQHYVGVYPQITQMNADEERGGNLRQSATSADANGADTNLGDTNRADENRAEMTRRLIEQKEAAFVELILKAYRAEKTDGFGCFHGKKAGRLVAVGPVNLPVTRLFVEEVILECRKKRISRVDILGFEFEMGLFPNVLDEARAKGIDIAPKYIPAEVFDKRAVEKNQVVFHDVSFIEVKPLVRKGKKGAPSTVAVELTDFSVFYSQDSIAGAEAAIKNQGSRIVAEKGRIVKVSKDKSGVVTREVLTKSWTDWIDYWSVDFDFESKRELIRVKRPVAAGQDSLVGLEPPQGELTEYEEVWTGDYIFENEWQSFRTKKDRTLELTSVFHECRPGRRKIAVKVVDIFGNDTMTIVEVEV